MTSSLEFVAYVVFCIGIEDPLYKQYLVDKNVECADKAELLENIKERIYTNVLPNCDITHLDDYCKKNIGETLAYISSIKKCFDNYRLESF